MSEWASFQRMKKSWYLSDPWACRRRSIGAGKRASNLWDRGPRSRGDREFSGVPRLLRRLGLRTDKLRGKHRPDRGSEQSRHVAVNRALQNSACVSARHHPDAACILLEDECDSAAGGRPPSSPIGHAPMKMLHREGLTHRPVGPCCEPLSPETLMTIPAGGEVQRFPIGRPVGPVLSLGPRDGNPGAFGNRLRSIDGCDSDMHLIWLSPNRKADPSIVGRKPAVEQMVIGMLQEHSLLMRSKVQNVDLIWIAAEHQNRLLVT
jgi:hypothetical protein